MSDILIEVTPPNVDGYLAPKPSVPESFSTRAAEIADGVADVAARFRERLDQRLADTPDDSWGLEEIKLTFEVAVVAESGVVIAKAGASATFGVELTWQRRTQSPDVDRLA